MRNQALRWYVIFYPRMALLVNAFYANSDEATITHVNLPALVRQLGSIPFVSFAKNHPGFCGFFVKFVLNVVVVDSQLRQEEELSQSEFVEHVVQVFSAFLSLVPLSVHKTRCTVNALA